MKKIAAWFLILFFLTTIALPSATVKASPKTITVPDDYPTIQAAIESASDGDKIFLRAGTYDGPINKTLKITKSVSLVGENAETTKIVFHPLFHEEPYFTITVWVYDKALEVSADDFKISGLTLTTNYGDIQIAGDRNQVLNNNFSCEHNKLVINGNKAQITDNKIVCQNIVFTGSNNVISQNTFELLIGTPSFSCKGSQNIITGNNISSSKSVYVEGQSNQIQNNIIDPDALDVDGTNNIISKNKLNYLILLGQSNTVFSNIITSGLSIMCFDSTFYGNAINISSRILWRAQSNNIFYDNDFTGNMNIELKKQSNITDYWDNGIRGNYWSTYQGADANNDGIGDTPYSVNEYVTDRYPRMKPFTASTPTFEPLPSPTVAEFPNLTFFVLIALLTATLAAIIKKNKIHT
jgi:nitrous oxidase accessory protein